MNVKSDIEWSLNKLAVESGLDRRTVRRLIGAGEPNLRNLVAALRGRSRGIQAERERLTKAQADMAELELGQKRNELVHLDDLCARLSPRYSAMRSIVSNSGLDDDSKRQLLEQLHHAHVTITPPPTPAAAEATPE